MFFEESTFNLDLCICSSMVFIPYWDGMYVWDGMYNPCMGTHTVEIIKEQLNFRPRERATV